MAVTIVPSAAGNVDGSSVTGTGSVVLSTSPSLITPDLGAATCTSLVYVSGTSSFANISNGQPGLSFNLSGVVNWANTINYFNTKDVGISRITTGVLGIGSGASGSVAGNLSFTHATVAGFISSSLQTAIVATSSIAPTKMIVHLTGTSVVHTITIPYTGFNGQLTIIPDGAFTTGTGGNIALASTGVLNKALIMSYDSTAVKWYPSY